MKKTAARLIFIVLAGGFCLAQNQPCSNATLADVLGTTCTIGHIAFTFGTNFNGFAQTNDFSNNLITTPIFPQTIGFVPITTDNQSGFQLVTNFAENTNGTGLSLSSSAINFSYGLKADDTSEVISETGSIAGNVTQVATDNISALDEHRFLNGSFVQVAPTENFVLSIGSFNQPSVSSNLPTPGITSPAASPSGLGFTTAVNAFAFEGDDANLSAATFLYTTATRVPTPPAGNFQVQIIDLPGVPTTFAAGINDRGQVAGFFTDSLGQQHGYLQQNADFQTIDVPNSTATFASAVSNHGTVAGSFNDAFGVSHGFTLDQGSFTSLDFPGANFTSIIDINARGDQVGVYQLPDFSVHGFIQNANGLSSIDSPFPPFFLQFTEAFGINDHGIVNGLFLDQAGVSHGFSLAQGVFQQIDVPGAGSTSAEGLNDSGDQVGIYTDLDGGQHGYLQRGKNFLTLDIPGGNSALPLQISESGVIVGTFLDDLGQNHSFQATLQPGSTGQGQGSIQKEQQVAPQAPQTCSTADWATHPERMRKPRVCHPANQ